MPVTALVMACLGPLCSYTVVDDLKSAAQCERLAPFIGGMARAETVSMAFTPADQSWRLSFRCLDGRTRQVLLQYDSAEEQLAAR